MKSKDALLCFGNKGGFNVIDRTKENSSADNQVRMHHKDETDRLREIAMIVYDLMADADWKNKYYMPDMLKEIFRVEGMTSAIVSDVWTLRLELYDN